MSRILLTSDWHLTGSTPIERIDDYPETQCRKVLWIQDLCTKERVDAVLHSGDIFDSAAVSHYIVQQYIEILKTFPLFFVTSGQHDLFFHSTDIFRSPLMVLHRAQAVRFYNDLFVNIENIHIDFCGFGIDMPEYTSGDVLVIHKMIINEKLWEGQEDATYAGKLLRRNPYKVILSGDNHKNFIHSIGNKKLINPGSLMRMKTDQLTHQPRVYILDTKDWAIKEYDIPIEPAEKVFNTEKLEVKKEHNEHMIKFTEGLKSAEFIKGLNVESNLLEYEKKNKIEKDVVTFLEEIFNACRK